MKRSRSCDEEFNESTVRPERSRGAQLDVSRLRSTRTGWGVWKSKIALQLLALHGMVAAVPIAGSALALGRRRALHLGDDAGQIGGLALDRAGQRVAAERPETHAPLLDRFAVGQPESLVVDHQDQPIALDHRPQVREIERHDLDVLALDVPP